MVNTNNPPFVSAPTDGGEYVQRVSFNKDSIDVLTLVVRSLTDYVEVAKSEALNISTIDRGIGHVAYIAGRVDAASWVLETLKETLADLNKKEDNDFNTIKIF